MSITGHLEISAVVHREDKFFVASCHEFDIASQGKSIEKALINLKEALELFLEDEDIEKLSGVEAPMVTILKVNLNGSPRSPKPKSLVHANWL